MCHFSFVLPADTTFFSTNNSKTVFSKSYLGRRILGKHLKNFKKILRKEWEKPERILQINRKCLNELLMKCGRNLKILTRHNKFYKDNNL